MSVWADEPHNKDAIQGKVEKEYAAKMRHLKSALSWITDPAPGTSTTTRHGQLSAMTALSSWIDTMTPEPPHQPLGTELPHRIVDYKAGPPTLGTAIAPAYAPNTPGAIASTLPVTPTAEDLTQTVEVQFTEDISATANELGRDPVKMYEFVRNTMDYEPYYGSRKGANETLWEKAGNDFDQASLLIALYRYSGIPARYVYGVVEIPIEKAMNWVGVEVPEAAAKLFSAAGVPVKAGMAGGKIVKLQMEHCWVEAYPPYEDYRGLPGGSGTAKRQWIPLDPSWKQYESTVPTILSPAAAEGLWRTEILNPQLMAQELESRAASIAETISRDHPGATVADLAGARNVRASRLGLLPPVLSLRTTAVRAEYATLPQASRYRVRFELDDEPGGVWEAPASTLAAARTTVAYVPSTPADADLLASRETLFEVPAYLVRVRLTLSVDRQPVAAGRPVALGTSQELGVTFTSPGGMPDHVSRQAVVGGLYGLTVGLGRLPAPRIAAARQRLLTASQALASGAPEVSVEDISGEVLGLVGSSYFAQTDRWARVLARTCGVSVNKEPSLAIAAFEVEPSYVLGLPIGVRASGATLDVRRDVYTAEAANGGSASRVAWAVTSGGIASGLEDAVLEELFGVQGVSAVRLLALSVESDIPILRLDEASLPTRIDDLDLDSDTASAISSAVRRGRVVVVPSRPVAVGGGQYVGWAEIDPRTGDSAYPIRGLGGGIASFNLSDAWQSMEQAVRDRWAQAMRFIITLRSTQFVFDERLDRWRDVVSGQIAGNEKAVSAKFCSLLVAPMTAAVEQLCQDLDRTDLSAGDKAERALIAFEVFGWWAVLSGQLMSYIAGEAGPLVAAFFGLAVGKVLKTVKEYVIKWYEGTLPEWLDYLNQAAFGCVPRRYAVVC